MISRQSIVALQHRNFRLIWIGLLLSFTGSMMQNAGAAVARVAARAARTRRAWRSASSASSAFVPIVVFSLVSGVVADALDRRRLMLVTQAAAASVALAAGGPDVPGLDGRVADLRAGGARRRRRARSTCRRGSRSCRRSSRANICRTRSA